MGYTSTDETNDCLVIFVLVGWWMHSSVFYSLSCCIAFRVMEDLALYSILVAISKACEM